MIYDILTFYNLGSYYLVLPFFIRGLNNFLLIQLKEKLNQYTMREFNVVVGENGRMIIPAMFRKHLNLKAGDEVVVKLSVDNDIIIHSPKQSLQKLQQLFKGSKESFVNELFEMRKKEEV